jgi:hypothetical protein
MTTPNELPMEVQLRIEQARRTTETASREEIRGLFLALLAHHEAYKLVTKKLLTEQLPTISFLP